MVSSVLPDFEVDGAGPAFIAALIASVLGLPVQLVATPVVAPYVSNGGWLAYVVSPAISAATLAVGITLTPGIKAGLLNTLLAAVLVSAAISGLMFVIVPLLAGFTPSGKQNL